VVDTNVLVAGVSGFRKPYIRRRNHSGDLLHDWAEKSSFTWLVTEDILDEYQEVAKAKHGWRLGRLQWHCRSTYAESTGMAPARLKSGML